MEVNYIGNIKSLFKNVTLNAVGAEKELYDYIVNNDVMSAINMMDDNRKEVDNAIREYNTQTHRVMNRHDKDRYGKNPYISEKLPRNRAQYINEVELFFLLGKPIKWSKRKGDDEAYEIFLDFLEEVRFDSLIRTTKRLAGSETEAALVFNLTKTEKGEGENRKTELSVTPFVVSRSKGYNLRTLFDQYGNLIALAYGYNLRSKVGSERHWDILTANYTMLCKMGQVGWDIDVHENPTGKINAIYFRQPKAWDGAVPRIEREEMLDSKLADTNNYFADPIAAASADVIDSMVDPDKPGKMIQLSGSASRFEYVNPPQNSVTRDSERKNLNDSILFDTFTPDFSYDNIRGLGSLSGEALHNALIIGYIKRDVRIEIYGELVGRLRNVMLQILKFRHPDKAEMFDGLKIKYEFSEPFDSDKRQFWASIGSLYGQGLISLELAVQLLSLTSAPDEEISRIQMAMQEQQQAQIEAAEQAAAIKEGVEQKDTIVAKQRAMSVEADQREQEELDSKVGE